MLFEIMGWVGSTLFALCGVPQAWHSWKQKNSDGLTWLFLWMWMVGEILTFVYVSQKDDVLPLLINYGFNFMCLLVILWYKFFPHRKVLV